jgi:hypothetical protein
VKIIGCALLIATVLLSACSVNVDGKYNITEEGNIYFDYKLSMERTDDLMSFSEPTSEEAALYAKHGITVEFAEYTDNGVDYVSMRMAGDFFSMEKLREELGSTEEMLPVENLVHVYEESGKYYLRYEEKQEGTGSASVLIEGNLVVTADGILVETNGIDGSDGVVFTYSPTNSSSHFAVWEISKEMYDNIRAIEPITITDPVPDDYQEFYSRFSDVPRNEDGEALYLMYVLGIMNGVTYTTMEPYSNLTREQAVMMLYRAYESHAYEDVYLFDPANLADVEDDRWSRDVIVWAIKMGILNGTGTTPNGKIIIDPEGKLTHEQLFAFVGRALGVTEDTAIVDEGVIQKLRNEGVSDWALLHTHRLTLDGVLSQFDRLDPQEISTRVFFAKILSAYRSL